jgi:uncharacterized protein
MASASSAPEAFLAAFDHGLIIDEVQLVPQIFRTLKVKVDELRMKEGQMANGRYLLTGSSNVMALPNLSDPLVGRMSVITLNPFLTSEASGARGDGL